MCANDFLKIYATQKARQQTVHTVNFNVWLLMKTRQSPRGAIAKRPSQKIWRFDVTGFLVLMCKKPIAPLDKGWWEYNTVSYRYNASDLS